MQPFFGPNAFSLDAAGQLWVVTERTRADSTEVDVFGPAGDHLGTLALRDRVQALAFRGDRMVALVVRTVPEVEGIAGLDLYRIEH
jgi:sugar lactone lactonase YvrE